jgi:cytochrome c-type biogenesis protein CcmH
MPRPDSRLPGNLIFPTFILLALISTMGFAQVGEPGDTGAAHPPPDPTGITGSQEAAEVTSRILCMCGTCVNQTLHECTCGTAAAERANVEQLLAAGRSPGEILEEYIENYGLQIMTTPEKSGFNLFGWLVPFIVAAGALLSLTLVLRGWIRNNKSRDSAPTTSTIDEADRAYHERLEEALREIES